MLSVLCQTKIKADMERKGILNFSFIDWRSLDPTDEIKHAGSNRMLMENGLLSLLSSIQGTHSMYTLFKSDLNFILYFFLFLKKIKQINTHTCLFQKKTFQLSANYSYFALNLYLIDKTDKIPCAILEWSYTILELRNQVGIRTLRRAILEWYRFLLCAEHI